MTHHIAESAIGAGPMVTLTELRDVDAPHGVRTRVEAWRKVPLVWGDHAARSLLLQAFAASGILASYLLTLQLAPPPVFSSLALLKCLAVVLLLLATFVAPIELLYRALGVWCLVMYATCTAAWVLMDSTDVFGPNTYGELDGIEVAAFGVWLLAYLILRMRHPIAVVVAIATYCVGAVALCTRVMPDVRRQLDAGDEASALYSITDEIVLRVTLLVIGLLLVALAWWLDGWLRPMLPIRVPDAVHADDGETTAAVLALKRYAWIAVACFGDIFAIVFGHQALLRARVEGIRKHDEFMIRAAMIVAYMRFVLGMLTVASFIVILAPPMWR